MFLELLSSIYYLSMKSHSTESIGEAFWTGLINPDGVICYDDACFQKLLWPSDGSKFDNRYSMDINVDSNDLCLAHDPAHGTYIALDRSCTRKYYYACEYSCGGSRRSKLGPRGETLISFTLKAKLITRYLSTWHCPWRYWR